LRIRAALALVLLCGVPLLASSAGRAATSVSAKCIGSKSFRLSSTVCEYHFQQPFLLSGYSTGGSSTLSYAVQCGHSPIWPMKNAVIDRRVWYKRSITVSGAFSVLGAKGAPLAAKHCVAANGKAAVLIVKLKMSKRVKRTNLDVRLDSSLPWGR
jgi:hypothetical protein